MELLTLQDLPRHYSFHSRRDIEMTDTIRHRPNQQQQSLPGINDLLRHCPIDYPSPSRARPEVPPLVDPRPIFHNPFPEDRRTQTNDTPTSSSSSSSFHRREQSRQYDPRYSSAHTSPRTTSSTLAEHHRQSIFGTSAHTSSSVGHGRPSQTPPSLSHWSSRSSDSHPSYTTSSQPASHYGPSGIGGPSHPHGAPPPPLSYPGMHPPSYPYTPRSSETRNDSVWPHQASPYTPIDTRPAYEQAYHPNQYVMHGLGDGGHGHYQRKRRGNLPKEATDQLKAWFHAHKESPYPTEDQKNALCHSTGLTINQVSNWFINARRRNPGREAREAQIRQQQQQQMDSGHSNDEE